MVCGPSCTLETWVEGCELRLPLLSRSTAAPKIRANDTTDAGGTKYKTR